MDSTAVVDPNNVIVFYMDACLQYISEYCTAICVCGIVEFTDNLQTWEWFIR